MSQSPIPKVVSFHLYRRARSSIKPKDRWDFPPIDIPAQELVIYVLDHPFKTPEIVESVGIQRKDFELIESFKDCFQGIAESAVFGSGRKFEKLKSPTDEGFYVVSQTLQLLPLNDEHLSPEDIKIKETEDWESASRRAISWASTQFESSSYLMCKKEDEVCDMDDIEIFKTFLTWIEREELRETTKPNEKILTKARSEMALKKRL